MSTPEESTAVITDAFSCRRPGNSSSSPGPASGEEVINLWQGLVKPTKISVMMICATANVGSSLACRFAVLDTCMSSGTVADDDGRRVRAYVNAAEVPRHRAVMEGADHHTIVDWAPGTRAPRRCVWLSGRGMGSATLASCGGGSKMLDTALTRPLVHA